MIQRVAAYLAILVGYFFYCYNFVIIDYVRPYIVDAYDGINLADTRSEEHTSELQSR